MILKENYKDLTWVAFDTETSGKYPLAAEICEIAATKWKGGKIIGEYQSLCKVSKPMSDFVISIHNITNEMLKDAPTITEAVKGFHEFIQGSVLLAHHAPFDMGFLAPEFEKLKLPLPEAPVVCTSLLSRKVILDSENHRLQTLIGHLNLPKRQAHRALSDAESCMDVALKCFEKLEEKNDDITLGRICEVQGVNLHWQDYSILQLKQKPEYRSIIEALESGSDVQIVYMGGSRPGEKRTVTPMGLVRKTQTDDFLIAQDKPGEHPKRYFLNKIKSASL